MSKEEEKKDNEQYSKNFTRFPNIIFVAFSDLSKEEKFLYGELRRVYWDMKPRFVTLRELSPLVHYSTGALSKMLPRLHDSGLIHAEVRREKDKQGKEKGNSKYHISIVDIWEINRYFFSCSPNEQDRLASLSSAQLVHEIEQSCSPNEQPCSRNDTSLFTKRYKPDSFGEQDRAVDALHNTSHGHPKDITKDLSKDTFKEESTYPQPESQPSESGSAEPTCAHALSDTSQDIPNEFVQAREYLTSIGYKLEPTPQAYQCEEPGKALWSVTLPGYPGFETWTTTEIKQQAARLMALPGSEKGHNDGRSDDNDHLLPGHDRRDASAVRGAEPVRVSSQQQTGEHEVHPAEPVAARAGRSTRTGSGATQPGLVNENNNHSQLSTSTGSYPQRGAKVAPRPSAFVAAPLFGTQKPARPQLTEEGKNVLEWYQIIQACKVRKTDANINACNGLGEEDGMSFDNLKKAIEHWEAHSYVKERQIPIDLQKLEDPKGAFTFAKAMLVIRPNKPKPTNERKPALVSCANMSAEEYAAYLRR